MDIKTAKRKINFSPITLPVLKEEQQIISNKLSNISLVFKLDHRAHDIFTNSSMKPIMQI